MLSTAVAHRVIWPLTRVFCSLNGSLRFSHNCQSLQAWRGPLQPSLTPGSPLPSACTEKSQQENKATAMSPPPQVYNPIRLGLVNPSPLLRRATMLTIHSNTGRSYRNKCIYSPSPALLQRGVGVHTVTVRSALPELRATSDPSRSTWPC